MSAGINTCAILSKVQLLADLKWADSAKNKDYIAEVATLTAIRENQTVLIEELQNPMKDKTVTLYWPEQCDDTTEACSNDCVVSGPKPGTQCKDYALSMCRTASFSVDEKAYRAIAPTFEEAVAVSMLRKMKSLDEWLAVQAVTKLDSNKGVNAYTAGKGTVSGFNTNIAAAYWNASLFGYLSLVTKKNKFTNPYLISGTNLYEADFNARMNAGNAEGKGAAEMFKTLKTYFDVFNVDTTLSPDLVTFLVNQNALAFHNKAYWNWNAGDQQAEKWGGVGSSTGYRYKVESKNLPGVFYDVTYKIVCANDETTHSWQIKFTGDIFVNPVGCNINNTNILKFKCA
ncbi:MAG: hypothetical protein V4549_06695 [Bacteroidota bacterium]